MRSMATPRGQPPIPSTAGPHHPVLAPRPPRRASVRRLTTIDTIRDGRSAAITAWGRDVRVGRDGADQVLDQLVLRARLGGHAVIEAAEIEGDVVGIEAIVGSSVASRFRATVAAALPDLEVGSLLAVLLDDWPGASLVSGYGAQRRSGEDAVAPVAVHQLESATGVCAGWSPGASMLQLVARSGRVPTPVGPMLEQERAGLVRDDGLPPLRPGATRRRRRTDVWWDDGRLAFDAHFRDTYGEDEATESVVHEYLVKGEASGPDLVVRDVRVEPRVLPWRECPQATPSSERLVGVPLAGLRAQVRRELRGVTTCTHLNDTFRTLEDVAALRLQL